MTVKEALEQWETYALHKLSHRTFQAYRRRLKELLSTIGDRELPLSKPEIAHAIGNIISSSVREQTIAAYQSLRKFLRDFSEIELPEVPDFIKPKTRRELPKPVSEEVFWKMLRIAEERAKEGFPWKLAAIILMGLAGLRASEALSVNQFSLEKDSEGVIWIRVRGKGRKERRIPLPKNQYIEWLWENRQKVLPLGVHYQTLYQTVQSIGKKAGDPSVTPHQLRHTYGTMLSRRGIPVQIIQELMGHSSPITTMGYVKIADKQKVEAVEKIKIITD
ncbi:tyrosine-type recombinase/integrase [Desulfurobacterium crinifex]